MESWFSKGLQKWYQQNKRDLPWRNEQNPYKIWLSEIILQQTQVKQGLSYYLKFIKNYPTVKDLAKAEEDKVLKDWQGLGYYSRARNLHSASKSIINEHKGRFPKSYEEIRKLKGVGAYTAAAIASFAYDEPHAVVDGNVYRLLSRVFGLTQAIDSGAGKKEFQALADNLIDTKNPALYNQAIMEFGSQFCKPSAPDCINCIFKSKCHAFAIQAVNAFPVKSKKAKVKSRYFNYLVLVDKNNNIALSKRTEKDIWKGLYDFLLIESANNIEAEQLFELKKFKQITGKNFNVLHSSKIYKHILTHQHLFAKFYIVKINKIFPASQNMCKKDNLLQFAFPRLIEKFFNDCKFDEFF